MHGPDILAGFLSNAHVLDRFGNTWQYNSRSDQHSKVGCWGVAFDLLSQSALLREHAATGKVVLGVNHSMTDFVTHRTKKLDLVIARPVGASTGGSFKTLRSDYGIFLSQPQIALLDSLPDLPIAPVGSVQVALEAKAAMTAHVKALPRLYDELNSSHLCVHGASAQAIAIGYVQVNAAKTFASSVINGHALKGKPPTMTVHPQPNAVERVLKKVAELPRRNNSHGTGFDGLGVTVLDFRNVGELVSVVEDPPAPQLGDPFYYEGMIVRMANEYDSRFAGV